TSTLTPFEANRVALLLSTGICSAQDEHPACRKSKTTTLPRCAASVNVFPSIVVTEKSGAPLEPIAPAADVPAATANAALATSNFARRPLRRMLPSRSLLFMVSLLLRLQSARG